MGIANLILLVITLISQGFLLITLLRQRVSWHFPFFVSYLTFSTIGTALLTGTNARYDIYYYVFWANEAGVAVFSLLALHEVFRKVFLGYYAQYRWFRMLFPAVAVLTVLIVYWFGASSLHRLNNHLMRLILALDITANFIEATLVALFIAIARTFKLRRQFAPLGIILGFGIAGAGSALALWARSEFGTEIWIFMKYVPPVAYIVAIAVWLDVFYFRPEPQPGPLTAATLRQLAEEMRQDAMILDKIREKFK